MGERLDEERLEVLRTWGAGLSADSREELRAAGKAIVILIEEIERLQVDIWHARGPANPTEGSSEKAQETPAEVASSQALATRLRDRLKAAIPGRAAHDRQQ